MQTELEMGPINYKVGDRWEPIVTDLVPDQAGGLVADKNSFGTRLAPVGSAPNLVTLDLGKGIGVAYGLEGAKPVRPTKDTDEPHVASYENVLPGVDLDVRVLGTGIKEDLILHSAQAGDTFTFPLKLTGDLTPVETEDGIEFRDAAGEPVAVMPHGWMKDSANADTTGEGEISSGAKLSLVKVDGRDALRLTLDRAWLNDPKRVFPVRVDPTFTTLLTSADDTYVSEGYTNDYSTDLEIRAGTYDSGAHTNRSFMHFPLGSIMDQNVTNADLKLYNRHSWSCEARTLEVRRILESWSGSSTRTWPGPSIGSANFGSASFAHGYSASCPDATVAIDVTTLVQNWANRTYTNYGLAIKAANETDNYGWKKFNSYDSGGNRPRLDITWGDATPPGQPVVKSTTHASEGTWYSTSTAALSFATSTAVGYDYVLDHSATTDPGTTSLGSATSKSYTSLTDGLWYFHVRAVDSAGNWSVTEHFSVRTDTTGPVVTKPRVTSNHVLNLVGFEREIGLAWDPATDTHAGVDDYVVEINKDDTDPAVAGDANSKVVATGTSTTITVPSDGKWYVHLRARDKATDANIGNDTFVGPFLVGTAALTDLLLPEQKAQSNELGLEQFQPYQSTDTGVAQSYVQLRTGNLVTQQEIATVPGQGLNAVLRLTHNAQGARRNTGFGKGWSLSVADVEGAIEGALDGLTDGSPTDLDITSDVVLSEFNDVTGALEQLGYATDSILGEVLEFTDGDGTSHRFVRTDGPGSRWDAPPGVDLQLREELTETPAGSGVKIVTAYELIRPDGVVYRIEPQHKVLGLPLPLWRASRITDRNGNSLVFKHANFGPAGINNSRLTEVWMTRTPDVADSGEKVASFTYADGELLKPAQLTSITTLPETTAARTIGLVYGTGDAAAEQQLIAVKENTQTGAAAAEQREVRYSYNADNTIDTVSEGLPFATAPAANQVTNFDYASAKVDASDIKPRAQVIKMTDRNAKAWTWEYSSSAVPEHTTTAKRPQYSGTLPLATIYEFNARQPIDNDKRVAGGNITKITDAAGKISTYGWTANKMTSSTDGAGNKTSFTYNGLGLLTSVTAPPPNKPGLAGAPADAVDVPVTSTLTYAFNSNYKPTTCTAPAYGASGPVTNEGLCAGAAADLTRVTGAEDIDAQQRVVDFGYDSRGNMQTMIERANADGSANNTSDRATTFSYYANGALAKMDGPRKDVTDVTCYGWAADNTADCSTSNAPTDGGYHNSGLPLVVKDALGKKRTFTYSRYGMKLSLVDRDNATTTAVYNALDDLVSATAPGSKTTTYGYDRNGNKTSETSPGGKQTIWSYTVTDQVSVITSPGTIATSHGYFDDGSTAWIDGPLAGTVDRTNYTYLDNGQVSKVTAPAATGVTAVTDYEYDAANRLTKTTTPVTNGAGARPVVSLTLTPQGAAQINATTAAFDGSGTKLAPGNANRKVTTFFNAHGEPITSTGPRTVDGVTARTDTTYDAFGQPTTVARTKGGSATIVSETGYDLAGNQIRVAQPTGNGAKLESTYRFDAINQLIEQTFDPVNTKHRISYAYTGEGQQSKRIDWEEGVLDVGANTPCTDILCVKKRVVDTTFNPDNSQASQVFTDFTVGANDPQRMKATCNYADGAAPPSGFDNDGNLEVTRTVVGPAPGSGSSICDTGTLWREQTFTYNTRGLIDTTVQKVRNPGAGNLVTRTQAFTYHADGSKASVKHTAGTDSYTTTYASSPAGWNESVTDWHGKTSTTGYYASGAVKSASLGGGIATASLGYHVDGALESFVWNAKPGTDPAVVVRQHTDIRYDEGGLKIDEKVAVRNPGATELPVAKKASYSHDVLDRLTSFTSPFAYRTGAGATAADAAQPETTYTLDDGGNITLELTKTDGTERRRVTNTYTRGQLTKGVDKTTDGLTIGQTTTNFTYSTLGEETKRSMATDLPLLSNVKSTTDTKYDGAGHTKSSTNTATLSNGAPAEDVEKANADVDYRYDTGDRVIARTETKPNKAAEQTLIFYLGGTGSIAEETDGQGDTKVRYLLDADGETLGQETYKVTDGDATNTDEKFTWLLNDAVGNTATLIAGADGKVLEQKAFDPYGATLDGGSKRTEETTAPKTALGFQSARTDEATGRVMLAQRQYDPSTGRFTTPDSYVAGMLDLQLGTDALTGNRYLFAGANPAAFYEDGHGLFSSLKKVAKAAAPALEFVPVVSTAVDVVNAATGKNWYEGGRPMSGAERMASLGGAVMGVVPGGNLAKAGLKAGLKGVDKAKSARKLTNAGSCPIGGSKNSFTLDTPVLMADGTTKAIGELGVGDWVWSTNPVTGEAGPRPITAVIEGEGPKTLVEVATEDGQILVATDGHPVYIANEHGWVNATDLRPGDELLEADGDRIRVAFIEVWHTTYQQVRNLTVAGFHTYHVGRVGDSVLVHNDGCTTPPSRPTGFGLLRPGKFADEWVDAVDSAQKFAASVRAKVNKIGYRTGCHSCGVRTPGTKSGNFVPDHMPVSRLNFLKKPQRLYPQCLACSRDQGLLVARIVRMLSRWY